MCAVGGFYLRHCSPTFGYSEVLKKLCEKQIHRGPDGDDVWLSPCKKIGLTHNRLAIIDLSPGGTQPMQINDGAHVISFNGEIYNWRELREELQSLGVEFTSNSDTEVVIRAYDVWGQKLLDRLRGMYCFAIWDNAQGILFCARDRIGKKPFIYSQTEKGFFFASEIPALKCIADQAGVDLTINESGLANMLLHNLRHIPDPLTVFKGIYRLRAGHALIVKNGVIKKQWRYWNPSPEKIDSSAQLRSVIEDAVSVRSIADVPVGALLSGGLDSTAIVSIMQSRIDRPLQTYAFGENDSDIDILRARDVAKELGTHHKEFYYDPEKQYEIFKKIMEVYGEPIMLLPLIHSYELSEKIRDDGIKVVLNGNGADELFYGYKGHLRTAYISRLLSYLGWIRKIIPTSENRILSFLKALPGKRKSELYRAAGREIWPKIIRTEKLPKLTNTVADEMLYWGDILPNKDFIDESNYLSLLIENTHSLTTASDLPGMMASIEMRAPFLDQQIVERAMGIDYRAKVRGPRDGSQLKYILREAVKGLVPKQVLVASKRGFGQGIQERDVLLGPWRVHADRIFSNFPMPGFFDAKLIEHIWKESSESGDGPWSLISKLFAIGIWCELNYE